MRVILTRDRLIRSKNWGLLKAMNFCTSKMVDEYSIMKLAKHGKVIWYTYKIISWLLKLFVHKITLGLLLWLLSVHPFM